MVYDGMPAPRVGESGRWKRGETVYKYPSHLIMNHHQVEINKLTRAIDGLQEELDSYKIIRIVEPKEVI